MNIVEEKLNNSYVISVNGRLDAGNSSELEEKIVSAIDNGEKDLVVNFTDLEYISSSGLRVLLVGAKKLDADGKKLSICCMKDHIKEVFDIAGFTPIFNVYGSLQDALR